MSHIILYGFNAVGKTFFGKKLAERNKLPFIDIDLVIETLFFKQYNFSLSYKEIYQQKGNYFFRYLEKIACFTLKHSPTSIVALGGGTLEHNFDFLTNQGLGLYLKCSFHFIYERLTKIGMPFIFKKLKKKSIKEIFYKRCVFYESFPKKHIIHIDTLLTTQQIIKQMEHFLWETILLEQH